MFNTLASAVADFRLLAFLNLMIAVAVTAFVVGRRAAFVGGSVGAVCAWLLANQVIEVGGSGVWMARYGFWSVLELGAVLIPVFALAACLFVSIKAAWRDAVLNDQDWTDAEMWNR